MNKRQMFRCAKYGIMIIAVWATSSVFCPGQEAGNQAGNRGNTMPASAIWRQFFSGQFSPEMMQWYVQQNRTQVSTPTATLQRDLQNQRNRIGQRSFVPVDHSQPRTTATNVRKQPRSVAASSTSSASSPEYLNMLGRLEFSLDKLGQKPNEILAPPSSSAVMARFISGRKTPEMTEWKERYTELANMRRNVPSPTSESIQENMIAAREMPQMTRPESSSLTEQEMIRAEQERESIAAQLAQAEAVRVRTLTSKPEGYDSAASVRLVSGVVPENEMPATYSFTRPNRSEQGSAIELQEQQESQPAEEPEVPGKMKVYRPREDSVRTETSRPVSPTSIQSPASQSATVNSHTPKSSTAKTPAAPKPLVIVHEENEWNPVPAQ